MIANHSLSTQQAQHSYKFGIKPSVAANPDSVPQIVARVDAHVAPLKTRRDGTIGRETSLTDSVIIAVKDVNCAGCNGECLHLGWGRASASAVMYLRCLEYLQVIAT